MDAFERAQEGLHNLGLKFRNDFRQLPGIRNVYSYLDRNNEPSITQKLNSDQFTIKDENGDMQLVQALTGTAPIPGFGKGFVKLPAGGISIGGKLIPRSQPMRTSPDDVRLFNRLTAESERLTKLISRGERVNPDLNRRLSLINKQILDLKNSGRIPEQKFPVEPGFIEGRGVKYSKDYTPRG